MFDELRDLYSDAIRTHGRTPRHAGRLGAFDASARGDNPMCGDRVEVFVRRDGDTVAAAGFEARGCEVSIASADLMCEAITGLPGPAARALAQHMDAMARTGQCDACDARLHPLAAVHRYPSRRRCVTLPWSALVAALDAPQETVHG